MNPQYPTYNHPPVHKPNNKKSLFIALSVVYLIVLLMLVGAYSSQNNKLQDTKKDLAKTQSQLNPDAMKSVDQDKYQAVFLNTQQVYFGHIETINQKYLTISDIFYLNKQGDPQSNQTATTTNTSLIKLGCEMHMPEDKMVINLDQVTFWENLQPQGEVAQAINQFYKQNPDGQKCPSS